MKVLIKGLLVSLWALTLEAAHVSRSTGYLGGVRAGKGPLKFFMGVYGAYSQKEVTVNSSMRTKYTAEYLYAQTGQRLLVGDWRAAAYQALSAEDNYTVPLTAGLAGAHANIAQNAGREFVFSGRLPERWFRSADGDDRFFVGPAGAGLLFRTAAAHVADTRLAGRDLVSYALFRPTNGVDHEQPDLPADKAWVPLQSYEAEASHELKFNWQSWGLRMDFGLGVALAPTMSFGLVGSYLFDLSKDKNQKIKDKIVFKTQGREFSFKAVNGRESLRANLIQDSFAYANGQIASGMSIKASVVEKAGLMGVFNWSPLDFVDVCFRAGVKRYVLDVTYEGGDLAYPGTVSMYTDAFTKEDGRYKLLISQQDKKRELQSVEYPFVYGVLISLRYGVARLSFGVDYASFDSTLWLKMDKEEPKEHEKIEQSQMVLSNPYEASPNVAHMVNAEGVHQMLARDVTNTLVSKVSVQDIVMVVGCQIIV